MNGETEAIPEGCVDDPPLGVIVAEKVASYKGVDPDSLEPLYSVVDPDALEDLFAPTGNAVRAGRVEFQYESCHVVVYSDGHVEVTKPEPGA